MRRLSTVRTYNGLLPSKFSNGPKGVSGARFLAIFICDALETDRLAGVEARCASQ